MEEGGGAQPHAPPQLKSLKSHTQPGALLSPCSHSTPFLCPSIAHVWTNRSQNPFPPSSPPPPAPPSFFLFFFDWRSGTDCNAVCQALANVLFSLHQRHTHLTDTNPHLHTRTRPERSRVAAAAAHRCTRSAREMPN